MDGVNFDSNKVFGTQAHVKGKRALVVAYGSVLSTPPMRQAAISLQRSGFKVMIVQLASQDGYEEEQIENVPVFTCEVVSTGLRFKSVLQFIRFKRHLRQVILTCKPDLIVTATPQDAAAVPAFCRGIPYRVINAVLDIPSPRDLGYLDKMLWRVAMARMRRADLVWASDDFKAMLVKQMSSLADMPLVCHNAPLRDYLPAPAVNRHEWLRNELRRTGATIGVEEGSILLRAGAIGECGGIEETMAGMSKLPSDFIFLMMGRPSQGYERHIRNKIQLLGLEHRAFLWNRPDDNIWRLAMQGADIGHLVHGPFPEGRMARQYEFNSSLSNNRLFQYMAAGLPILAYDDVRMSNIYSEVGCFQVARLSDLENDILSAWKILGGNKDIRRSSGDMARLAHIQKYCWEVQFDPILKKIETLYFQNSA